VIPRTRIWGVKFWNVAGFQNSANLITSIYLQFWSDFEKWIFSSFSLKLSLSLANDNSSAHFRFENLGSLLTFWPKTWHISSSKSSSIYNILPNPPQVSLCAPQKNKYTYHDNVVSNLRLSYTFSQTLLFLFFSTAFSAGGTNYIT
jgi:hypothetical protein